MENVLVIKIFQLFKGIFTVAETNFFMHIYINQVYNSTILS